MKIHTRLKRKYGLTTSFRHKRFFSGLKADKNGEKTFRSAEGAKAYASKKGLKDFSIVPAKKGKKYKVEHN